MPDSFAEDSNGVILIANGIDLVQRWDGFSSSISPAGVIPPATPIVLSATGSGTITGSFFAFYSFIDNTGLESSLSPVSNVVTASNNATVTYDGMPSGVLSTVVRKRIYRSTAGQGAIVYLDIDTDDVSSVTLTSTRVDTDIQTDIAFNLLDANNIDQTRFNDPPRDTKPFITWFMQHMYYSGSQPYAEGSVAVTAGSTQVYGAGTSWPANFGSRFIYIDNADQPYQIDTVDAVNQVITLLAPYGGITDPFAAYAIRPAPAEEDLLFFSLPGQPQYCPIVYGIALPQDNDVTTGMFALGSYLYIMKRISSWRWTVNTDPTTDGFLFQAADRGMVNHMCAVVVGGNAYIMDERGVYLFDGSSAKSVSDPVQTYFRPDSDNPINWLASRFFHAVNDPAHSVARFFVCLRGDYLPRHCLAYSYALDRWSIEEYPFPVGSSTLGWSGRPTATWRGISEKVYLGSWNDQVYVLDGSEADGVPDGTGYLYTVTGANMMSVNLGSQINQNLQVGFPVALVNGRGRGQIRNVLDINGTTLRLDRPWLIRPAAGDQVVIGGIRYQYRTHLFDIAITETDNERALFLQYERRPGETADIKYRFDVSDDWITAAVNVSNLENAGVRSITGQPELELDLGKFPPKTKARFDGHSDEYVDAPQYMEIEISGISGGKPHSFDSLTVKGVQ